MHPPESDGVSELRRRNPPPACWGSVARESRHHTTVPMPRAIRLPCRSRPQQGFAAFPTRCCVCVVLGGRIARGRRSRWSLWRSICRGSAAHAVLRCAVDLSGRDPFRKALVGARCRWTGPPEVGRLVSSAQEEAPESRGPLWPTRIEMGQGFVNDSSRLQKNGPPLSCFRITRLDAPPPTVGEVAGTTVRGFADAALIRSPRRMRSICRGGWSCGAAVAACVRVLRRCRSGCPQRLRPRSCSCSTSSSALAGIAIR